MATTLASLREQIRSNLEAGNLDAAAESCILGLNDYPRWVEGHRFLGEISLSQDALAEAQGFFELVAAAEPDNATPYVGIGVVQEHLQHFPEAVVAFERALDLDQSDIEVRQELARLYNELHLSRSVQTTRAGLAHQHLRNHMIRQAQGEIDSLLSIEPGRLDLMVARARTAWIGGQLDVAEQTAREIIDISPDCVIANLIVGELLARAGKTVLAAPFLTSARELDPEAELTASALQDVESEGVVIAPGLPTAIVQIELIEQPLKERDSALVPTVPDVGPSESLPDQAERTTPRVNDESTTPAVWQPAPFVMGQTKRVTVQPGALESLLKDLDQVWPERLDLSDQPPLLVATTALNQVPPRAEPLPIDDEDLPPSFLGDVSEIIREFEDPNDHYDLFADVSSAPPSIGVANTAMPSVKDVSAPLTDPWAQTAPAKQWTGADDITVSGQHAIIDLSATPELSLGSTEAASEHVPALSATNKPSTTGETLSQTDPRVELANTHSPWDEPVDGGSFDVVPSPTEHELAVLLASCSDSSLIDNEIEITEQPALPSREPAGESLTSSPPEVTISGIEAPDLTSTQPWNPPFGTSSSIALVDQSSSESMGNATAKFLAGQHDEALRALRSLVRQEPDTAERLLTILDEQAGGNRVLRLQVTADCLMASKRYWEAMAKYTEALDVVRAQTR